MGALDSHGLEERCACWDRFWEIFPFFRSQGGLKKPVIKLPIWGNETLEMYGEFEGFTDLPFNGALFGLVIKKKPLEASSQQVGLRLVSQLERKYTAGSC